MLDRTYLRATIAVGVVVASFLLRQSMVHSLGLELPPFIFFYPAVMVVAILAGFWPGLLATVTASLLATCFIFPPQGHLAIANTADLVSLVFFLGMGTFMSWVAERHRRYERQIAAYKREEILRESNEKLRQSEKQFETLANAIPQLCWIANSDGWIFWYNQRWYEYSGTTPQQMEGWGWQSVHDPESLPKVLEQWKASIATGVPFDMVFPLRGADGVFRPFLTRVVPVKNAEGAVIRWFGTNTDISEQKQAEQALRDSEERYRSLFNSMDEGFCIIEMIFDADGKPADYRFLEVNAAFENQTGMHEAVGKRMLEIAPSHEAYWFEIYGKIALTGEPAHFENEAKALDRYYEVGAYRVGAPELRQVAIVFNDISGRKRAEEVLRSALDEKTALLKEVHHRVKNNMQIVSSLLNLQVRGVKNDAALETLRDTQGRIRAMALLHETLYRESNFGRVNCSIYFSHLCAHLCRAFGQMGARVRVKTEIATVELGIDVAIPCGLIINELVSNSFKHAFPDGRRGEIMVKLHIEAEGRIVLSVGDDGIGLPPGADYQQSSTLGAKLVTGLAKQIAGTLEVKSDHGTMVQVNFIDAEKGRPLS